MRGVVLAAMAVVLAVAPALAAGPKPLPQPQFTTLDSCALKGRGLTIAEGNVCLEITGGVSYYQSWGNAYGGQGTNEGLVIVTTPAGVSTIPAPR